MLKWFVENGGRLGREVCTAAAGRGRLDAVQWILEHGGEWVSLLSFFLSFPFAFYFFLVCFFLGFVFCFIFDHFS